MEAPITPTLLWLAAPTIVVMVRAERVAWVGAGLAAAVTVSFGPLGALFPRAWIGLFSTEPQVLTAGATYLRLVGPTYGFFGLGLALYFGVPALFVTHFMIFAMLVKRRR